MTHEQALELAMYAYNLKHKLERLHVTQGAITHPDNETSYCFIYDKNGPKTVDDYSTWVSPHIGTYGTEDCTLLSNLPGILQSEFVDHPEMYCIRTKNYDYAKKVLNFIFN